MKTVKKSLVLLIILSLIASISFSYPVYAEPSGSVTVYINDKQSNSNATIINDIVMVSSKWLVNELHWKVEKNSTELLRLYMPDKTPISIYENNSWANIGGNAYGMLSAPVITDDDTYISLQFVCDAMNYAMTGDNPVYIVSKSIPRSVDEINVEKGNLLAEKDTNRNYRKNYLAVASTSAVGTLYATTEYPDVYIVHLSRYKGKNVDTYAAIFSPNKRITAYFSDTIYATEEQTRVFDNYGETSLFSTVSPTLEALDGRYAYINERIAELDNELNGENTIHYFAGNKFVGYVYPTGTPKKGELTYWNGNKYSGDFNEDGTFKSGTYSVGLLKIKDAWGFNLYSKKYTGTFTNGEFTNMNGRCVIQDENDRDVWYDYNGQFVNGDIVRGWLKSTTKDSGGWTKESTVAGYFKDWQLIDEPIIEDIGNNTSRIKLQNGNSYLLTDNGQDYTYKEDSLLSFSFNYPKSLGRILKVTTDKRGHINTYLQSEKGTDVYFVVDEYDGSNEDLMSVLYSFNEFSVPMVKGKTANGYDAYSFASSTNEIRANLYTNPIANKNLFEGVQKRRGAVINTGLYQFFRPDMEPIDVYKQPATGGISYQVVAGMEGGKMFTPNANIDVEDYFPYFMCIVGKDRIVTVVSRINTRNASQMIESKKIEYLKSQIEKFSEIINSVSFPKQVG